MFIVVGYSVCGIWGPSYWFLQVLIFCYELIFRRDYFFCGNPVQCVHISMRLFAFMSFGSKRFQRIREISLFLNLRFSHSVIV